MSTGYDEDGTLDSLICVMPPGGGTPGAGGNGGGWRPTIIQPAAYGAGVGGTFVWPVIALGVGDFSIEFWTRPTMPSIVDSYCGFGFVTAFGSSARWNQGPAVINVQPNVSAWYYGSFVGPTGAGHALTWYDNKWKHVVANYDRNVQIELYVDGVLVDTQALPDAGAPTNIPNAYFVGPCWDCGYSMGPPVVFGPIAAHAVLLTTAQMRESMGARTVQNLATTYVRWDWRDIEGATWVDWSITPGAFYWNDTDEVPHYEKRVVSNAAVVRDSSGNGNDATLMAGRVAFSADSFFR